VVDTGGKLKVTMTMKSKKPWMCFTKETGQVLAPITLEGASFPSQDAQGSSYEQWDVG